MGEPGSLRLTFRGHDLALIGEDLPSFSLFKGITYQKGSSSSIHFRPADALEVLRRLEKANLKVDAQFPREFTISDPGTLTKNFTLREYQQEGLKNWLANQQQGIIVLPTGTGKTFLALAAINATRLKSLIIVPTIALLDQWVNRISTYLGLKADKIGVLGGGKKEIKEITVSTYDSAYLHVKSLRKHFGLLIFDECHHLAAPSYRVIAEGMIAPSRLGLSATPERSDGEHKALETKLIGPILQRLTPEDLSQDVIADYELKKVYVDLPPAEQEQYNHYSSIYRSYLRKKRISIRSGRDFERKIIFRVGYDPEAREALRAHRISRKIAFAGESKIKAIENLLIQHEGEKTLIFSENTEFVEKIGRTFLIPIIHHRTAKAERELILRSFTQGSLPIIATGRVLDEGLDVADASVAIIVSGSAQPRQFIQRLGRILRPAPGKETAILYEIITSGTVETRVSSRRKEVSH
ncbi:MAG: DEAD/DEAH box helicase [Candidatus Hermodarchaeota archaeon]